MNCKECQPLFSGFSEKSLTPVVHEGVVLHVAGCPACRRSLRDFQRALAMVRSVKPDAPPAGLKIAVLAAVDKLPRAMPPAPRARERWRIAAAAILLFAAALAVLAVRERSASIRIAALEEERNAKLEEASRESVRLAGDLRKASAAQDEQRRASAEALSLEAQRRRAAETSAASARERAVALETEARRGETEVSRLDGELAAAREEVSRLGRDLAAARAQVASQSAKEPVVPEQRAAVAAVEPQRPPSVVFKRRGGHLELSVRGPRNDVIPELLAIARDDSSPETAELALNALENLLDVSRKETEATPESGGWLNRRLEGVASALGMHDSTAGAVVSPDAERDARRNVVEEAWRALSTSTQE